MNHDLMPPDEDATAVMTDTYRYNLCRFFAQRFSDSSRLVFVMLNPSTADGTQDDPTVRKCRTIAEAHGAGSIEIVNLYAYRATDPRALITAADPVGPDNDSWIRTACERGRGPIIAAWGASGRKVPSFPGRVARVTEMIRPYGPRCLGLTKGGFPKHPLFASIPARLPEFVA